MTFIRMRFSCLTLLIAPLLVLALWMAPAWAARNNKPCEAEPERTLEQLLALDEPGSKKVPKGFVIDRRPVRYHIPRQADGYNLPSKEDPRARGGFFLKWDYTDTAICRVQDEHGTWWLATRHDDGFLDYILEEETELAQ